MLFGVGLGCCLGLYAADLFHLRLSFADCSVHQIFFFLVSCPRLLREDAGTWVLGMIGVTCVMACFCLIACLQCGSWVCDEQALCWRMIT
jgi:hypothetical protein